MKKRMLMLSLLLMAVMIVFTSASVAFADEDDDEDYSYNEVDMTDVTGIRFKPAVEPITFEEKVDGIYDTDEPDSFFYSIRDKVEVDGDVITLIYEDGTETAFAFNRKADAFISADGYGIDTEDVYFFTDQYEEPWGLGDHTASVEIDEFTYDFTVKVVENTIETMEYIPVKPFEYIENDRGRTAADEDGNEYFRYSDPYCAIGDILKITRKDGTSTEYVLEADEDDIYYYVSEDGGLIKESSICWVNDQDVHHWVKGGKYYTSVIFGGKECRLPVTVVESPIDSIEYEPVKPYVYTENVNGYMEEDDDENEYFEYMLPDLQEGDKLIVNRTVDGEQESRTYIFSDDDYAYVDGEDRISFGSVDMFSRQETTHWTVGEDNELYVKYLGRICSVKVTVRANEVGAIRYEPAEPYVYEEYDTDEGDWEIDEDGEWYFEYGGPSPEEGDRLIINNGAEVEYIYDEDEDAYISEDDDEIDGDDVDFYDDQEEDHWEPDKENYVIVEYAGKECRVPVKINAAKEDDREFAEDKAAEYLAVYYEDAKEELYELTDASYQKIIAKAEALIALLEDSSASSKEILAAAEELRDASLDAEYRSDEEIAQLRTTFTGEANQAIAAADALDPAEYTEASYKAVTDAKTALQAVLAKGSNAHLVEIKNAADALNDSIKALEKKQAQELLPNTMKVTAVKKTFKAKALKKKAKKFKSVKVKKAVGAVKYSARLKGKAKKALKFNKKNGKVTVKKGTRKGTYKLVVTVKAAGSEAYLAGVKKVTVKVKVK